MAVAKETVTALEKQFRCIAVCNLCQGMFTNPRILPCFHSFCLQCLNENTTPNLQSSATAKCPACRTDILIPMTGVAALPINEFVNSILATADALSSIINIGLPGFQRTDGSASRPTAEQSEPAHRSHDTGRGKSAIQIDSSKNRVTSKANRVCHKDNHRSCASAKIQRIPNCKTHRKQFNSYCCNCTQVMCPLCNGKGHSSHLVISIDSDMKDLRQIMNSYLNGIESCQAYYRAQNDICETAREGRTSAGTLNRMNRTPVRPDSRGSVKSGRCAQILPLSPLSSRSLDTWKEYAGRFYKEITTRGLDSDILNISKKLYRPKLHETWHQVYEQLSPVQQSHNKNSPCARVHTSTREIGNRRDLEQKEQCVQKLSEQVEWVANQKRFKDVTKKQSQEKCWMAGNLNEQETKCLNMKTRRDWFAGGLRLVKEKSKLNIADKLNCKTKSSTPKVSPHNQTRHESSVIEQLPAVNEQQKLKLLHQIQEREEYYINEKAVWDQKEKQFMEKLKWLESQACAINKEKEYFATQYITEQESHERSKSEFSEILKEKFEWMCEKELCIDSVKELKSEKGKLENELREQQKSKADIQKKLTEQVQNKNRLRRELEQLISWIERIDMQRADFQITPESASESGIIEKLRASIIKKTKELTEKERLLLHRNEDFSHQMEELKSKASIEQMTQQRKSSNVAVKEHEWSVREKQYDDKIKKLQVKVTVQQQDENRRDRELEKLISWIERIDKLAEFPMTTERDSENSIIEKLRVSIVKKAKELSENERLLMNRNEELSHQMAELKSRASSELMAQQLKNSGVAEKERACFITEKQGADQIQELECQIDHLKEDLTQQHESNRTTQGQLEAALRRESHLTAEFADLKQRLGQYLADKKQEDDTGLLRDLENLIKWIDRGDRQPTVDQITNKGESQNSMIKKIKASIIKTTEDLRGKDKQLLQTIEESGQQIAVLRQTLATEEANQRKLASERDKLMEKAQLLKNGTKQLNAIVQELESQIHDLQDALTQQKERNNKVENQLKAALIKHGVETSLKQRLEHELSLTQLELEHLIQWIDTVDKQSTDTKTKEEESQNDAIQKLKVSIKKKTNELKSTEKQLLKSINVLELKITELEQSLTREQKMHQASLRNSDANLHKQLREKDRMHEAQVKQLNDEIHNLKQQHLSTKNTYDDSTAVQSAASRKPTLPTGISNVGNTCYFGATMQNLVYTFLLTEELHPSKQSPKDVEQLLTKAYKEFIRKYYEANCEETFRHMYKEFCKKSSRFADRGQHDSHDLFVNFLNCLRDEERRRLGSVNMPGFRNVLTAVDKVFGGHTITVYVCSTCKTPYHVCEPFLDISVPILGPKDGGEDEEEDLFINHLRNPQSIGGHDPVRQAVEATMRPLGDRSGLKTPERIFKKRPSMPESIGEISLKQCLVYYSRTERIHNEYLCNPCEAAERPPMTSALKRTLIYNPPSVLVLHLKRFEQTTVGFKKCNQRVTYDEFLDIGPYCSSSCLRMREPDDANIWYSLYGVVVHKGSLTSGHYISYIKVRDCDTRQAKQFMQQTFLNREQVLNEDDIGRINANRGMVRSRKEWEPREVVGQWYLADDEYVKAVEKTEALSQEAYLLFYERVAR